MLSKIIEKMAFNAHSPGGKRKYGYPLVFLFFFLPIILFAIINYGVTKNIFTQLVNSEHHSTTISASHTAHNALESLEDSVKSIASHPLVKQDSTAGKWNDMNNALKIFREINDAHHFTRILVADPMGVIKSDTANIAVGQDQSYQEWFQGVNSNGAEYVTDTFLPEESSANYVFAIAAPIVNDEQIRVATVVVYVQLDVFDKILYPLKLPANSKIYITDGNGRVISGMGTSGETIMAAGLSQVNKALRHESGTIKTKESLLGIGQEAVVSYAPMEDVGWAVIVETPKDIAYKDVNKGLNELMLVYIVFLIFYGSLARPIVIAVTNKK